MFNSPARQADRARAKAEAVRAKSELDAARADARAQRRTAKDAEGTEKATGVGPWYVTAVVGVGVSIDTSWLFFGDVLHITGWERPLLFGVLESALFASGWSMRASVKRTAKDDHPTPGPARWVAYGLLVFAAYMALTMAGPVAGLARTILGPGLALLGLHMALGIEVAVRRHKGDGALAKILHEWKQRFLSLFGVDDGERAAVDIRRDRAAARAARLAVRQGAPWSRKRRLLRALRVAGTDPHRRAMMLQLIADAQNIDDLRNARQPSPWAISDQATDASTELARVVQEQETERHHKEEISRMQSKRAAFRYALDQVDGEVPAAIDFCARYGVTISTTDAYRVVKLDQAKDDTPALPEKTNGHTYPMLPGQMTLPA